MLISFCESIDNILFSHYEVLEKLKKISNVLRVSLKDDEFRLEVLELILDSIESWNDREKKWNAPPIYYNPSLGYSIRIVFWPAFYENNPHEHKTWGITGVFHNKLNINTYEKLDNPVRLKKEKLITAEQGEVGFLMPGCIHNVNNISHELSASFHVFNNVVDINHPEENAIWYPAPRKHHLSNGLVERALLTCLAIAEQVQTKRAFNIISRIYSYTESSSNVKLNAIKSLYRFDREYARYNFNQLELIL